MLVHRISRRSLRSLLEMRVFICKSVSCPVMIEIPAHLRRRAREEAAPGRAAVDLGRRGHVRGPQSRRRPRGVGTLREHGERELVSTQNTHFLGGFYYINNTTSTENYLQTRA